MGGAIRQAVKEGRTVIVELMTRGTNSGARSGLCNDQGQYGKETPHDTHHDVCLSENRFGDARAREFTEAIQRLGVTAVHVNDYTDGSLTAEQVGRRISFWTAQGIPGLQLSGTAGKQDYDLHPDHNAVYQALKDADQPGTRWFMVYQNRNDHAARSISAKRKLPSDICAAKRQALLSYRTYDPGHQRYAVGWLHSTGDLFDGAYARCIEYNVTDHASVGSPGYLTPAAAYEGFKGLLQKVTPAAAPVPKRDDGAWMNLGIRKILQELPSPTQFDSYFKTPLPRSGK
jgi:LmbE family N-acetylglucosaminyl deacetylase